MKKLILSILVLGVLGIGVWAGPESSTLYDMMMKDKSLLEIGEENIAKEKARLKKLKEREEKRSKTKEVLEFLEEEKGFEEKYGEFIKKLSNKDELTQDEKELKKKTAGFYLVDNLLFSDTSDNSFPTGNLSVSYTYPFNLLTFDYPNRNIPTLEAFFLLPKQKQKLITLLDKFFEWQKIAKKKKIKLNKRIGTIAVRYALFLKSGHTETIYPVPIPIYYETKNNQPVFTIDANSLGYIQMKFGNIDRKFKSLSFSSKNARLLRKALSQKEIDRLLKKEIKRKQTEDALFN